ncbi:MAG: hypothetical protein OEV64_07130, partial [Desulfobulbaceae bacterium]|nr:hypothetical protein [Desulfobulbaceae bacterium]
MLIGNDLREYGVDLYNPTRFEITLKEGTKYIVSTSKGLESMTDVYGHTISYTENSITHSDGGSITFERGEGNRIEWITDIFGRKIEYIYGEDGMLEKVIRHGNDPVAIGMAYNYTGLDDKITLKEIKAPDGTVLGSFDRTLTAQPHLFVKSTAAQHITALQVARPHSLFRSRRI